MQHLVAAAADCRSANGSKRNPRKLHPPTPSHPTAVRTPRSRPAALTPRALQSQKAKRRRTEADPQEQESQKQQKGYSPAAHFCYRAERLKQVHKKKIAKTHESESDVELPIKAPNMKNAHKDDKVHVSAAEHDFGAMPAESDSDKEKKRKHDGSDSSGDDADDESSNSDKRATKSKKAERKGAASISKDDNKQSKTEHETSSVSDGSSVECMQGCRVLRRAAARSRMATLTWQRRSR